MKHIDDLSLSLSQRQALRDLKSNLLFKFNIKDLVVYDSVVRSESDDESDLDVLVLTDQPLTRFERHQITDVVFEINLQYGTNISTLVVDRNSWQAGPISVLPALVQFD